MERKYQKEQACCQKQKPPSGPDQWGQGTAARFLMSFFECLGVRITLWRKMGHAHLPNRRFRSE